MTVNLYALACLTGPPVVTLAYVFWPREDNDYPFAVKAWALISMMLVIALAFLVVWQAHELKTPQP